MIRNELESVATLVNTLLLFEQLHNFTRDITKTAQDRGQSRFIWKIAPQFCNSERNNLHLEAE